MLLDTRVSGTRVRVVQSLCVPHETAVHLISKCRRLYKVDGLFAKVVFRKRCSICVKKEAPGWEFSANSLLSNYLGEIHIHSQISCIG